MLGGSASRVSIDSSRGVEQSWLGMLPYREPAPTHRLRSSGVTPAPCPISEPHNPIREPLQPPRTQSPLQPPVHNLLSLPSLPPIWCPLDRGVELGAPPGDNNASAVPKWCKITMLFNGDAKPGSGAKSNNGRTHVESSISASEVA